MRAEPAIGSRASPNDEFKDKTTAPNQMWQTDFTYLKVIGWGWFYLSTILDDYSRYVIGWKLCSNMRAEDVTDTLDIALAASGCDSARVLHKPRLLSDNGASYIAGDLAEYLEDKGMKHVRGAPMHPQTQGKIERWHQTLKNRILLENYFFEGELEAAIATFIDHYNNHRYPESIGNLTPADVYFGRGEAILAERRRIKQKTIPNRRLNHQRQAAEPEPDEAKPSAQNQRGCSKSFDEGQAGPSGKVAAIHRCMRADHARQATRRQACDRSSRCSHSGWSELSCVRFVRCIAWSNCRSSRLAPLS